MKVRSVHVLRQIEAKWCLFWRLACSKERVDIRVTPVCYGTCFALEKGIKARIGGNPWRNFFGVRPKMANMSRMVGFWVLGVVSLDSWVNFA